MRPSRLEFSDRTLEELLRALHARTGGHPDNPGLIACWPGVPEDQMAAACAELQRRGHPVFQVYVESTTGEARRAWSVSAASDESMNAL